MRRWFLSYTSQDLALTQALQAALKRKDPDAHIFSSRRGACAPVPLVLTSSSTLTKN
jgi:hypothetical protein